jgi:hypothetical protein
MTTNYTSIHAATAALINEREAAGVLPPGAGIATAIVRGREHRL